MGLLNLLSLLSPLSLLSLPNFLTLLSLPFLKRFASLHADMWSLSRQELPRWI